MAKMELDWKVGVEHGIAVFWGGKMGELAFETLLMFYMCAGSTSVKKRT